jgi:myo-inositol-1(or 4)-monophosphatase
VTDTELTAAATDAMDLARDLFRSLAPGSVTSKGDRDMASEVDYAIEVRVRDYLAERTPHIAFLGEENGQTGKGDGLTWALDPIDGTVNFIHGSPLCGISLALFDGATAVLGVIDVPALGYRYHAVRQHGAHRGTDRIAVSEVTDLRDAVVAIGDYAVGEKAAERNKVRLEITARLAAKAQRIRMHGSAAIDLALLAEGAVDAVIMLSNKPWDTAAGVIITREAGGEVIDRHGHPHDRDSMATIATNAHLTEQILTVCRIEP